MMSGLLILVRPLRNVLIQCNEHVGSSEPSLLQKLLGFYNVGLREQLIVYKDWSLDGAADA